MNPAAQQEVELRTKVPKTSYLSNMKKGQVGETVSWIVATIVIIGIMLLFIYISVLISKTKAVELINLQSDVAEKPEILMQKTSFSHQIAGNLNKEIIDNILNEANS